MTSWRLVGFTTWNAAVQVDMVDKVAYIRAAASPACVIKTEASKQVSKRVGDDDDEAVRVSSHVDDAVSASQSEGHGAGLIWRCIRLITAYLRPTVWWRVTGRRTSGRLHIMRRVPRDAAARSVPKVKHVRLSVCRIAFALPITFFF